MKHTAPISPSRLFLGAIVLAFTLKMILFIATHGRDALGQADGYSEVNSSAGARSLVADGFSTSLLPRMGHGNHDSGSTVILNSELYTHYFPGPDYVMAIAYKLFGFSDTVFQWTRLVPLLHILFGVLIFLWVGERFVWRKDLRITAVFALLLLWTPALRPWALNLHGHAYSTTYILLGMALGFCCAAAAGKSLEQKNTLGRWTKFIAFVLGFLSNYMLLTGAFVVCAAPFVGSLLTSTGARSKADRDPALLGFQLSVWVGIGLVAAFTVHFLQIVNEFGFHEAWLDQFGTAMVRAFQKPVPMSRIQILGHYSNHVYSFFGVSTLTMALGGLWLGWLQSETPNEKLRLAAAPLLAGIAGYAWILLMFTHSVEHTHVNPRIFYLMYAAFLTAIAKFSTTTKSSYRYS